MSRILAGRYELTEKIGEGGMAVVYKGRDRLLNRYVAIKILKPEFARDAKFIESFRRESQAAASLSHPNIVNIYDVGREGNIHYIVMELIEGSILSDLIKEHGALDWKRAVEITKQDSAGLVVCACKSYNTQRCKTAQYNDYTVGNSQDYRFWYCESAELVECGREHRYSDGLCSLFFA